MLLVPPLTFIESDRSIHHTRPTKTAIAIPSLIRDKVDEAALPTESDVLTVALVGGKDGDDIEGDGKGLDADGVGANVEETR